MMKMDARPLCLVTGATGFVGSALCRHLLAAGYRVRRVLRQPAPGDPSAEHERAETVCLGDFCANPAWDEVLIGADVVFHLAARVHVMNDTAPDPLAEFRQMNVEVTRQLAEASVRAGVRRFVYLSSIKVNGEETKDRPFTAEMTPSPADAYAQSKWEAEQTLTQIARSSSMEVAIIRPPLVYGPNVRGNFLSLLRLVRRGLPLPVGSVKNRRSLVYVENLADLLRHCVVAEAARGVFLISDGEDLSTPKLIRQMAKAMMKRCWLLPVPTALLKLAGLISGKRAAVQRLCSSLAVDTERTRRLLKWSPPYSVDVGMQRTVDWFVSEGPKISCQPAFEGGA
jgi:nucleoside-diphosphate-sugar epimerase